MNLKVSHLTALLLILLPSRMVLAEAGPEEAKRWLERMIQAAQSLNYEGTFVYVQGAHLEAMHIIHSGAQNGKRQRMSSLNGAVREVLVTDTNVTCLSSKEEFAFSAENYNNRSPLPISLPRELDKLESYYQFEMLGDDRVAGMETQIVAIRPRDQLRFGYRLWLERETGIVLRSALLNEQGDMVEQLMFINVQLKPDIDIGLLSPSTLPSSSGSVEKNTSQAVVKSDWIIANLPEGFSQVMHTRFAKTNPDNHPTEHIVFTDGLATISVFLEQLNGAEPPLTGPSQVGAMNAYGVVTADHQVMVIGEVPLSTVQMIASSIQRLAQAAK